MTDTKPAVEHQYAAVNVAEEEKAALTDAPPPYTAEAEPSVMPRVERILRKTLAVMMVSTILLSIILVCTHSRVAHAMRSRNGQGHTFDCDYGRAQTSQGATQKATPTGTIANKFPGGVPRPFLRPYVYTKDDGAHRLQSPVESGAL
ncbi:hypothetical protein IWQ60_004478 [Tieghemiomyces parasiticus]|uniref:Uncharacterized protein n=1 Tax=Tieghemiomyces parasiticus TaxID=78921 RepID=A0A9W8AE75_9FUNG|nr:hypothetical protein IWQ60_004478 [Tieghemiomyces parasiticus]